jgi:hypothetical protein
MSKLLISVCHAGVGNPVIIFKLYSFSHEAITHVFRSQGAICSQAAYVVIIASNCRADNFPEISFYKKVLNSWPINEGKCNQRQQQ